jgi:ATP-binding cassette subfamily F protein 2
MEAAGLIEKIKQSKPLHFNFEDIRKLPPPIIAFNDVAFSYSGKPEDYLYKGLSFGIEFVISSLPFDNLYSWRCHAAWTRA